jgi:hypothetical protein
MKPAVAQEVKSAVRFRGETVTAFLGDLGGVAGGVPGEAVVRRFAIDVDVDVIMSSTRPVALVIVEVEADASGR